ncbi:MAG: HAD family phosphatase [Fuerstiella sp.]|jgi:HAD superfamily hydrolase (TIGR01509 family)|nr:HAD family phosphatase [Fuerstiella sp.]MCP4511376.1 HAD family phosphatase [Fuerstiella sp.]MDG2130857.1 HAD family phosphatase [Fuerstiella sp.]
MFSDFPPIEAVVFDLDGLMLNTEDVFDLAGNELMSRRGMQMTDDIRHRMLGRRPDEAFQALKDLSGITDDIADLKQETRDLFAEIAENHLHVMPGLLSLLAEVERRKIPKAVATSSPRDYMSHLLEKFQLLHRFQVTLAAEDVTEGKPHPEIYLAATGLLDVSPENTMVLEDSETGMRAAAAAGTFVFAVPNRHTRHGDFSRASRVVSSLADASILARLDGRDHPSAVD